VIPDGSSKIVRCPAFCMEGPNQSLTCAFLKILKIVHSYTAKCTSELRDLQLCISVTISFDDATQRRACCLVTDRHAPNTASSSSAIVDVLSLEECSPGLAAGCRELVGSEFRIAHKDFIPPGHSNRFSSGVHVGRLCHADFDAWLQAHFGVYVQPATRASVQACTVEWSTSELESFKVPLQAPSMCHPFVFMSSLPTRNPHEPFFRTCRFLNRRL
jgi:hypothetical protein